MSIYKSEEGKQQSLALYDEQISKLDFFTDLYVETSFGKTHLIETGNLQGTPLLIFHGGNTTTAYCLHLNRFLLADFHIYAVDTIGQIGKSDEITISHRNYDYGRWASEVIDALGYQKMACFGISYGGGILTKLMAISPGKISKALLMMPAGIRNPSSFSMMSVFVPFIEYGFSKKEKHLLDVVAQMTLSKELIDKETLDMIRISFEHVKIKAGMPTEAKVRKLKNYTAPTLVIGAEKDCFFPAKKILPRAKELFQDCRIRMLRDAGHIHNLPAKEKRIIIDFLKS